MAELLPKQTSVPARWRIVFAILLVLAFWFAGWELWTDPSVSAPDGAGDGMDARTRLQTAAIAFSSGKLAPRVLILTDHPETYEKEDGTYPEFQFFQCDFPYPVEPFLQNNLQVFDPASIPGWGFDSPWNSYGRLPRKGGLRSTPIGSPFSRFGLRAWDAENQSKLAELKKNLPDDTKWVADENNYHAAFDVVLLDLAFPERLLSRKLRLFSPAFFDRVKDGLMNSGGVFAVVLPPDRPSDSACILASLRHSFGNAGAFCFGNRIILAAGSDTVPVFDLDILNSRAKLAGYYERWNIPDNAIGLVLAEDYSDSIPAGLLETAAGIRIRRVFTPFCAVFARTEIFSRMGGFLPNGFPLQTVCAWLLGILLAVYPFLRYFISWKPVHKQTFRAFEDMFFFTGALSLFLMFSHEIMPDCGIQGTLFLVIWELLFFSSSAPRKSWTGRLFLFSVEERRRQLRTGEKSFGRIALALLAPLLFGLAFFLPPTAYLTEFLVLFGLLFATLLVRDRMDEPVQPGAAIPAAFVLGVVASLAVFAASLFFPLGPVVFAAVICGFRLIFLDN